MTAASIEGRFTGRIGAASSGMRQHLHGYAMSGCAFG